MNWRFSSISLLSLGCWTAFGCDSASSGSVCARDEVFSEGQCLKDLGVSVNGVGFLPERNKRATFLRGGDGRFAVVNAETGETVFEAEAAGPSETRDTEESVFVADFSPLEAPGRYRIETGEGRRSAEFEIGQSSLDEALRVAMLGMYGYRCGEQVEFEHGDFTYRHAACHLDPASLSRIPEEGDVKDDAGGWHDAGDYGKYVRNGAFAVAFLLAAYEHFPGVLRDREFDIPERGGSVPDMLDEARVELEWILKTQFRDGSFAHKVTKLNFEPNVMPSQDLGPRYFFSTSTPSTANAVAVLAQGARAFAGFDATFAEACLRAARSGQAFLDDHPEEIRSDLSGASTGPYDSGGDRDERLWAFVELWETTGEPDFLEGFEALAVDLPMRSEFDWPDTRNLAYGTYLRSERTGRDADLVQELRDEAGRRAVELARGAAGDAYARATRSYYWGSNGVVARTSYNLALAHELFPNEAFADAITASLDHLFGQNPFARSFVTGLGANAVRSPHHRPSIADPNPEPWPGLLIGGPHDQGDNPRDVAPALNWQDDADNYWHNEVAINWSTALIYALTAAIGTRDAGTAACWPDDCVPPADEGADGAGGAVN